MRCKQCAWHHCNEKFEFCENIKDPDSCPRFFAYDKLDLPKREEVTNELCSVCKRDKDPGQKCWWCGN